MLHRELNRHMLIGVIFCLMLLSICIGSNFRFVPTDQGGPFDGQLITQPWMYSGKTCVLPSGHLRYRIVGMPCPAGEQPGPFQPVSALRYNVKELPSRLYHTLKHIYDSLFALSSSRSACHSPIFLGSYDSPDNTLASFIQTRGGLSKVSFELTNVQDGSATVPVHPIAHWEVNNIQVRRPFSIWHDLRDDDSTSSYLRRCSRSLCRWERADVTLAFVVLRPGTLPNCMGVWRWTTRQH